jgi:hypothetical protein
MKQYSLLLYFFICGLNIFLFLPVIFYPAIIAPLHMLILWLSFNWLLKSKKFKSNWNRIIFSLVPLVGEMIVIIILFSDDSISSAGVVKLLDNLFVFSIILLSLIEFGILMFIYSKYLHRCMATANNHTPRPRLRPADQQKE